MAQSNLYSRVIGTGSYLPPDRVTNQDLAERLAKQGVETSDEWIVARTGIMRVTSPLLIRRPANSPCRRRVMRSRLRVLIRNRSI